MCMSLSMYGNVCTQGDLHVDESLYAAEMHTGRMIKCLYTYVFVRVGAGCG